MIVRKKIIYTEFYQLVLKIKKNQLYNLLLHLLKIFLRILFIMLHGINCIKTQNSVPEKFVIFQNWHVSSFERLLSILEPIKSLIRTTIVTLSTSTLNFLIAVFYLFSWCFLPFKKCLFKMNYVCTQKLCMCTHAEQLLTMGTTCVADITEKSRFRK